MNYQQKLDFEASYPELILAIASLVKCRFEDRDEKIQEALCWAVATWQDGGTIYDIAKRSANRSQPFAKDYEGVGNRPDNVRWESGTVAEQSAVWVDRYCDDLDQDEHDMGYRLADLPPEFASLASMKALGLKNSEIAKAHGCCERTIESRTVGLRKAVERLTGR